MNSSPSLDAIHGIVLVNKPAGLTSNAVLKKVQRIFGAKKAGHTGSLDPIATGMLPVCFGEATKFSQFHLDADKAYEATGLLGAKTDTSDATGEVVASTDHFNVSYETLSSALLEFIGEISQIPSPFSALKHEGKRWYEMARQGISFPRKSRQVTIHSIELMDFDGRSFRIRVFCSKGTYIRNLVEDIGEHLGVYAHLTTLHRIKTAGFDDEKMYSLETLSGMTREERLEILFPVDRAVMHFPKRILSSSELVSLRQGKILELSESPGLFRVYDASDVFFGLAESDGNGVFKVYRFLSFDDATA